ncbi:MAG TPA: HYR domain-containing protein, partial [Phaeodactylibacter sp.]|nr:HYR domain-containing protein [Phaeodactylibacter sp.]
MNKRVQTFLVFLLCCISFNISEANVVLSDVTINNCPSNITVDATGSSGATVSWSAPTATTNCMVSSGTDCSSISENIYGYIYMGEYDGSKYYCSNSSNYSWNTAKSESIEAGGHLAIIDNSGENEYIREHIMANYAWIGLSDAANEGYFKWVDNTSPSYTEWASGEPNDEDPYTWGADNVVIKKNSGEWYDRNGSYGYEYVMEIDCPSSQTQGEVYLSQTQGLTNGSVFPIGTTTVTYTATDDCGNTQTCSFTVTVNQLDPCAAQGGDTDGDGVCDNQDCQPNNPNIPAPAGTACNDGNPNTSNDVILADGCTCAGTVVDPCAAQGGDNDGDGICNNDDCFPWNPYLPGQIGSPCDDGNPNTTNDVIVGDECNC